MQQKGQTDPERMESNSVGPSWPDSLERVNAVCTASGCKVWAALAISMGLDAKRAVELDEGFSVLSQDIN